MSLLFEQNDYYHKNFHCNSRYYDYIYILNYNYNINDYIYEQLSTNDVKINKLMIANNVKF